tara:strand:- start:6 stop:566 length:561 start_codon:yes stop_codon:yes gene_type:complete
MKYVKEIEISIDIDLLKKEVIELIEEIGLEPLNQISLTSLDGNDDWKCSTGDLRSETHPNYGIPEEDYTVVNKSIIGSYIEECINKFPEFYRWRIMRLHRNGVYAIHSDGILNKIKNNRIHIPIITNLEASLCFLDDNIHNGENTFHCYHLEAGKVYELDTTSFHTAINFGYKDRIHMIGVKNEKI